MSTDMERYNRFKAAGMCVFCGKNEPLQGLVLCAGCRLKQKESAERRRKKRRDEGKCMRCGKNPASKGRLSCEACRQKDSEKRKLKKAEAQVEVEAPAEVPA